MELILHVGHGKTGSSFLQSALATSNFDSLSYPVSETQKAKAQIGRLTSGNVTYASGCFDVFRGREFRSNKLLLSSESMFRPLVNGCLLDDVNAALEPSKIQLLLFVRNPLENAVSSYFQAVQKGFESADLDSYLRNFKRPKQVAEAIRHSEGAELHIANYSVHRKELLQKFSEWIGDTLPPPNSRVANRSLTIDEAAFICRLNRLLPRGATNGLGSRLCAELPEVKGRSVALPRQVLDDFVIRMKDQIDEVHELLGYEIYQYENLENFIGDEVSEFHLSSEQLNVIAKTVAAKWR